MEMYKVLQVLYDFENDSPYFDELSGTFDTKEKAECSMYRCVIDELECLNGINENDTFPERIFIATMEMEDYNVVINAWDGPDYRPVTYYKVLSIDELVEFFNAKLREKHGDTITVKIRSYEEDDGSIWFYYDTARFGESNAFETASEAYDDADIYLCTEIF